MFLIFSSFLQNLIYSPLRLRMRHECSGGCRENNDTTRNQHLITIPVSHNLEKKRSRVTQTKNDPILYQNIRSPQVTKHSAIAIYLERETSLAEQPFNGESTSHDKSPKLAKSS